MKTFFNFVNVSYTYKVDFHREFMFNNFFLLLIVIIGLLKSYHRCSTGLEMEKLY